MSSREHTTDTEELWRTIAEYAIHGSNLRIYYDSGMFTNFGTVIVIVLFPQRPNYL